jgi:hypothetical protein
MLGRLNDDTRMRGWGRPKDFTTSSCTLHNVSHHKFYYSIENNAEREQPSILIQQHKNWWTLIFWQFFLSRPELERPVDCSLKMSICNSLACRTWNNERDKIRFRLKVVATMLLICQVNISSTKNKENWNDWDCLNLKLKAWGVLTKFENQLLLQSNFSF